MALVIDALCKRFGDVQALDGISFAVQPGQVFGFLGPNGAGKTTTMRIVLDILHPDSGLSDLARRSPWRALRAGRGATCPRSAGSIPRMKVLDQLVFVGVAASASRAPRRLDERASWLDALPDRRLRRAPRRGAQQGQPAEGPVHRARSSTTRTSSSWTSRSPVSIPINVALLKDAFIEMRDRGKAIVFSTHQMEMVEELCDAIAIIDQGRTSSSPARSHDVKRQDGPAWWSGSAYPAIRTSAGSTAGRTRP